MKTKFREPTAVVVAAATTTPSSSSCYSRASLQRIKTIRTPIIVSRLCRGTNPLERPLGNLLHRYQHRYIIHLVRDFGNHHHGPVPSSPRRFRFRVHYYLILSAVMGDLEVNNPKQQTIFPC
mmetsp:Transcript_12627/g.25758  ORF Transcript_12627/g.25758 Transcript_12627/m.25758 type:complete len:122 (-) Transcript_12627:394-759(-)